MYLRGHQPIPLLIPSIDPDRQAMVPTTGDVDWVPQFMGWTLSARERALYEVRSTETTDRLVQLKTSVLQSHQREQRSNCGIIFCGDVMLR
jgi:hypothetical protein